MQPVTLIRPRSGWVPLDLRELWAYRELLYFLVLRDVMVRYKQTVLGAAWAVLQPVLTMVVFSLFFGKLAKIPSDGVPYPIWSYAALVPWTLFAGALMQASNSLVGGQNLIKKVYFPRLALPIAATLAGLVDFLIAFIVLLVMMAGFGITPTIQLLWLPALVLLALVTALGVALWLSALNVQFRDIKHTLPFLIQLWLFITPIAYPSSIVPEQYRPLLALNPMAGVVEGFRWALLGTDTAPGLMVGISSLVALLLLIGGAFYFRRMEKSFADVV